MDYSLLLVIENIPGSHSLSCNEVTRGRIKVENTFLDTSNCHPPIACSQVYHIAVIDYLQDYNFDKKVENFVLTKVLRRSNDISDIPSDKYQKRFYNFMQEQVFKKKFVKE